MSETIYKDHVFKSGEFAELCGKPMNPNNSGSKIYHQKMYKRGNVEVTESSPCGCEVCEKAYIQRKRDFNYSLVPDYMKKSPLELQND